MSRLGIKNLSYTQKLQIEVMYNNNLPVKQIAAYVGVCERTIYRELKKGAYEHKTVKNSFWYGKREYFNTKYSAAISEERYKMLCTKKGRPLKIGRDFELIRYVEKRVHDGKLTAHAVLGEIKHNNLPFTSISKTTLYRYIELGLFENISFTKRKKSYKKQVIKRPPKGTSIEQRPADISARNSFGHWEMDCVCGPTKATLLVLSERLTRQEIIFKIPNQKSDSVVKCLNSLERRYGAMFKKIFKSITVDNGSEFSDFVGMQKSIYGRSCTRTQIYYCHAYSSYERGTNERLNREIRRRVPKGTDLSTLTYDDVSDIERWLNNYPRKVLGYATSNELFQRELLRLA